MMGGQVGVSDHVQVGKNVKIGAQSGVLVRKVKDNAVLFGYPARDAKEYMKKDAFAYRLLKHADKLWKFLKQ
jgi:UDP-3-O-[3-hydroxymyristoyl] glucosamine N-acyltransferase